MTNKIFFLLFIFLMPFEPCFAQESFRLRGDSWCPFNCDEAADKKRGYMVEIADRIFSAKNIKVDYQILNWNRAKKEVAEGKIDAIVGASKTDGDLVYSKNELGHFENRFYVLKGNSWRYKNLASLKGAKVGVINDYTYGTNADAVISSGHNSIVKVSGDDALPNLIKMLELKRITALYENPVVFSYKIKSLGKSMSDFEVAGAFDQDADPLYIGFSKKFMKAQAYAKIIDEGIVEIRKSGELQKILNLYNLKDWVKK